MLCSGEEMEAVLMPWRDRLPIGSVGGWGNGDGGSEAFPSWPSGGADEGRGGSSGISRAEVVAWLEALSSVAGCVDKVPETDT